MQPTSASGKQLPLLRFLQRTVLALLLAIPSADATETNTKPARPNILWFVVDDMSPNFSCYGETAIKTPNVDQLASQGTRFKHAFITAPVCSPSRSAMITGMYQTTIGSHHHRSGRGELRIHLPEGVTPLPELFKKAGYHTCIGSGIPDQDHAGLPPRNNRPPLGKTDYNFDWESPLYNGHDWSNRKPDQPFFMQVQLHGGKLREGGPNAAQNLTRRAETLLGSSLDPNTFRLPPYYPADPLIVNDWHAYLDAVRLTDHHVGAVLKRLDSEGLRDNTFVIFMTDHGISHARGKQFLYNEGTHIPFIVRGPGIPTGKERSDLIEHIDMAAISLAAAGIALPPTMQGKDIFAPDYKPRTHVFAARDRCDETVERLRSVRSDRFLYIKNFHPKRPHLQPNAYKDGKPIIQKLRELHERHSLSPLQESLLFAPERPTEELYDWIKDPYQINNLAGLAEYSKDLSSHRDTLTRWIRETQDKGPESDAMYDSDMAVYLGKRKPNAEEKPSPVQQNITQMTRWAAEGR